MRRAIPFILVLAGILLMGAGPAASLHHSITISVFPPDNSLLATDTIRLGLDETDETVLGAMTAFASQLGRDCAHLVARPEKGSACKRMSLFLRWMVREDAVDPGGWTGVSPAQLIVPLDVHMERIGQMLNLTGRKSPNMGMALDITEAFRSMAPDDPVKYDFALTRFGIRDGLEPADLLRCLVR